MIGNIIRTGFMTLRRDRGAVMLSFIVPIAFFSIFAGHLQLHSAQVVRDEPIQPDHVVVQKKRFDAG